MNSPACGAVLQNNAFVHKACRLAVAGLLFLAGCAGAPTGSASRTVRVVVVAGQSNAVGYNDTRDFHHGADPFPAEWAHQAAVRFWPGTEQAADTGGGPWQALAVGASRSFGPEVSLGRDLRAALPAKVDLAIVKFAVGGSGIARSSDYTDYIPSLANYDDHGGNWHPPSDGREPGRWYAALLKHVRNAVAALEQEGARVELAGFVWMQGEHEGGISRRMAMDYEYLLPDFMRSVRRDLKAPRLPFVIGGVNSHTWAFGDTVRESQVRACRRDGNATLVPTLDLPRNRGAGGPAHFDADGMLELGSRFARVLLPRVARSGAKVATP